MIMKKTVKKITDIAVALLAAARTAVLVITEPFFEL